MMRIVLCITLISVAFGAIPNNRYGGPHSSGNYRGSNYQSGGVHSVRGPSAPGVPGRPAHPGAPGAPSSPSHPRQPSGPAYRAPAAYGAGRAYGAPAQHYSAPPQSSYQAPHNSYGGSLARGPSHYGAPSHNAYQPQRPVRATSSNNYPQQHSSFRSESQSQSHGREMKYTIRDPNNKGTTHVTETHVVSNREMHGAEAEAAMKKLMGNMGPGPAYGSDGGFQDFVKNMGLPYF